EKKKAELDTKLKAKLDCAKDALDKANAKITVELDAKAKTLEAGITKRKGQNDASNAQKRPVLQKQVQVEQQALRATPQAYADSIGADAAKQAEATQAYAEKRANDTEFKGESEANAAIAAGEAQAKRALDAAGARASSLTDSGEKDHVVGEGKTRAEMAR